MQVNPPPFPDKREKVLADDLLSLPPMQPIANELTEDELTRLYHYLANGNADLDYAMSFYAPGKKHQPYKAQTLPLSVGIDRAVQSVFGKAHPRHLLSLVFYPTNKDGNTCWGALDFDAHDGAIDRARSLAYKAWTYLRSIRPDTCVILEKTAGESFHVWVVAKELHPCKTFLNLLMEVVREIGTTVQSGVCELFPHAVPSDGNLLRPLCGAGSWHSKYRQCTEITACNLRQLVAKLPAAPRPVYSCPSTKKYLSVHKSSQHEDAETNRESITKSYSNEDSEFLSLLKSPHGEKEAEGEGIIKNKNDENEHSLDRKYIHEWASRFEIVYPNSRNARLKELVKDAILQVGRPIARLIAEEQYQCKQVETTADLNSHFADFDSLWKSLDEHIFLRNLTEQERGRYDSLANERDRDAFRIFHGFHSLAEKRCAQDFPIAQISLAKRLGLTRQGASKVVMRFMKLGFIERTTDAIPHLQAAYYHWAAADAVLSTPMATPKETARALAIKCDLTDPPQRSRTEEEQFVAFGDQIIALLALHGTLSSDELQRRIVGYAERQDLCETMLKRLQLKLVIDVNKDGHYHLGPERQHFKALVTQALIKQMVDFDGLEDSERQFETMAFHFKCDVDELKRQRDALIELGDITRNESGRLLPRHTREWPLKLS